MHLAFKFFLFLAAEKHGSGSEQGKIRIAVAGRMDSRMSAPRSTQLRGGRYLSSVSASIHVSTLTTLQR